MPKKAIFKKKQIHNKAYEMFEKYGLEEITARSLAKALNASPAPIYSYYESMDVLKEELIDRAKKRFLEYLNNEETEFEFLNIGLGICYFAREEKQLFKNIFLKDISYRDLIREFRDLVKQQMGRDERFSAISEEDKVDLFLDSWIYVHGFATLISTGYFENPTNEFIKTRLVEAPAALLYKKLEKRNNKK
ncbi:MAG: TetR/AcrR family transcriptional regulator [Fusobacteriaceae bacterium]